MYGVTSRTSPTKPKVSSVICVYNGARFLREAIESALNQTYPAVEVVVINDGSTDDSDAVCRQYAGRLLYRPQPNAGLARARNRGIRESTGEYIALLDQDDAWMPDKIEKQMTLFEHNPDLGLVFADSAQFDAEGRTVITRTEAGKMRRGHVLPDLYDHNFVCSLTALCPRHVLDRVGLFWEDLRFSLDWDLWLRIAQVYPVDFVDEPLAWWRWRPNHAEDNHEICLLEAYRIISVRQPAMAGLLRPDQNAGVKNRLARIAFSLSRIYRRNQDRQNAEKWLRTSVAHDRFTPEQTWALEEIETISQTI